MATNQQQKLARKSWYDNIALARKERNAEIIQGVVFHPSVLEVDEMARLQAIKEILHAVTLAISHRA